MNMKNDIGDTETCFFFLLVPCYAFSQWFITRRELYHMKQDVLGIALL